MSAPRTKRQFAGAASDPAQRQITSFFSSNGQVASSSRTSLATADLANTSSSLPDSIQSNLISVGMRVRKSVPEGYKTGTYSSFSLWDDSTPADPTGIMAVGEGRSRANAISAPRELLPFCGINRIGGLDTQPSHASPSSFSSRFGQRPIINVNDLPPEDDMPGLSSSQETVSSIDSDGHLSLPTSSLPSPGNGARSSKKRFFIEDEDELNSARANHLDAEAGSFSWGPDGNISPRSLGPAGWTNRGRAMAVPRKGGLRRKFSKTGGDAPTFQGLGQENVMVVDGSDFEEADFLDSSKNWEVEMNDA